MIVFESICHSQSKGMNRMEMVIICVAGFFAALVDSMVGGGGMISIPALMATGMPTHLVLGTNKFAASSGAVSSVYHYYKSGNLNKKILIPLGLFSLVGSVIGVISVLSINPGHLKNVIVVLLVIMIIYTTVNRKLGLIDDYRGHTSHEQVKGQGFALVIGFYDGFFGPGTGSFLIMMLIKVFKLDFKKAAANAKVLNMLSNIAALVMFFFNGQIAFKYGIPMALCMILGARTGTLFAIKKGTKWIKPIFTLVSIALVVKLAFEM